MGRCDGMRKGGLWITISSDSCRVILMLVCVSLFI